MSNMWFGFWLWLAVGQGIAGDAPRVDRHGDPLPAGALARLGTTRLRHRDIVTNVAWSPDGKLVAAAGQGDSLYLWDPGTGKEAFRLESQTRYTYSVAFSHDGKWLAAAGDGPVIHLWQTALLGKNENPRKLGGHPGNASAIVFAPDSKTLYSGGNDGAIRVWDVATGKELRSFGRGKERVTQIALSRDGTALAAVHAGANYNSEDNSLILLWDPKAGEVIRQIGKTERTLYRVVFSPDGQLVAAGGDRGPKVWEVASGAELVKLRDLYSIGYTPSVAFSPDGARLYAGGPSFLRAWAIPAGRSERSLPVGDAYTYAITFSPDGKTMATGMTRMVALWDAATGKPRYSVAGHQADVHAVVFTSGGRKLLTAGAGALLYRWDFKGNLLGEFTGPKRLHTNLVLSPDQKTLAVQGNNLAIILVDAASGKERLQFKNHLPPNHGAHTSMSFVFSPDSRRIISSSMGVDPYIRCWEVDTGKEIYKIDTTGKPNMPGTLGLALSPNGKTLYAAYRMGPIKIHDATDGRFLRQIGQQIINAGSLTLSPDGRWLAAISNDVHVWDAATGAELLRLPRPAQYRPRLVFSPDGRTLVTAGEEDAVRLHELATGQMRFEIPKSAGRAASLAFCADGRLLAIGHTDTTALLWDLRLLPQGDGSKGAQDFEGLWADLAGDARKAFWAIGRLQADGDKTVAALAKHFKPGSAQPLQNLIAQIDNEDFLVRERATKELMALGRDAAAPLEKALLVARSAEARGRILVIQEHLDKGEGKATGRLRGLRTLEVLEGIGTPAARKVLEFVATGEPNAEITVEARATLKRLAERK
jgi:WD40 repeat protein